ncbi:11207_t:CDS:1, partial [Dentiscutata erythropus]
YGISYGVRSISELTDSQILNIIDQVTEKARDMLTIGQEQNHMTEKFEPEVNAPTTAPIPLTYISNSSGPVNMPAIPYDARAPYINVALKEYPYLSLYNSDRHNDAYEFKNSGLCPGCGEKHTEGKVVGRCIKGSYYIKCRSSPNEKEIKISALPKTISSITHQA